MCEGELENELVSQPNETNKTENFDRKHEYCYNWPIMLAS